MPSNFAHRTRHFSLSRSEAAAVTTATVSATTISVTTLSAALALGSIAESTLLGGAVVESQNAAVDLLALEGLHALHGAGNIDEVGVGETSWLAGASVDGNADIENVLNVTEHLVKVGIGHLEGEVANEERLGRGVCNLIWAVLGHVVHDQSSALEGSLVLGLDGSGCLLRAFKLDVCETNSPSACDSCRCFVAGGKNSPFAQSPGVSSDLDTTDVTELSKLFLKIGSGDLEEQVPDVDTRGRGDNPLLARGTVRSPGIRSLSSLAIPKVLVLPVLEPFSGVATSGGLGRGLDGGVQRRGLVNIGRLDRLVLIAVEASECCLRDDALGFRARDEGGGCRGEGTGSGSEGGS